MYETNEHKIITSSGKFEGEMYFVPELWDMVLNGGADHEGYDYDFSEVIPISIFKIDQELINKYPELEGYLFICLWEVESGFVYSEVLNQSDIDGESIGKEFLNELRELL